MDTLDRRCEQAGNRQDLEAFESPVLRNVDRIRHHEFLQWSGRKLLNRRAGEERVCRSRKDLRRPTLFKSHDRVCEGTACVHHIVDEQTRPAIHIADHIRDLGHVGPRASLVDDRERRVEPVGEPARHLR